MYPEGKSAEREHICPTDERNVYGDEGDIFLDEGGVRAWFKGMLSCRQGVDLAMSNEMSKRMLIDEELQSNKRKA